MQKIQYLIIALLCAVAQGAWAQTNVGTADELRTAIDGNATNITLTANMTVDKHLTISRAITIDLGGFTLEGNSTALDGNNGSFSCIFIVSSAGNLTLSHGTLANADNSATTNAEHSAGAIVNKGTTTLTGVTIQNCKGYNGGAINNHAGATLNINSVTFTNNTASYCGGAIYNKGTLNFNSGSVSGSTAPYGGAIYNTGSFTMADGSISNCQSTTGGGGGIVNIGTVEISGGTFSGNTSATDGGAIWNGNSGSAHGTLTITGGTITTNTATRYGGGIWNENEVTITNCEISSNKGDDGGGFYNKADGNVTINSGTTFSSNTSENHSGGAINNHGKLTVNGGSFTSNTAKNNGGAIGNFDSGVLTINGGSFTGNSVSTYYGGGVYIGSGTFNLSGNVNITSNTANSKTDNLYLYSDNIINVKGALTGSSIGVTLEGYNRDFTSGFRSKNSGAQPSDLFSSDVNYATLSLNGNEAKLTITSGLTYIERVWEGGNTDGQVVSKTKRCDSYTTYNGEKELYSGWYLLSGSKSYDFRLVVHGTNTYFILEDGSNIEFKRGIHIDNPRTLTIYGQSGGTGKLRATGSGDAANAAIGGNKDQMSGYLVIHGGTVEASSSENNAAAIGGGDGSSSGMQSVTIYGGTVKATGKSSGAGIGSGQENSTVPTITIYGGKVTATGGNYAAGIGGGEECSGGTITIYKGTINATGGEKGAGIGGGEEGGASTITIYNGNVTANGGEKGAGIGGGYQGKNGTITIYKGTVNATGGDDGAGIGAGFENDDAGLANCTVTIYDGNVTATGGNYGAGIGGYASATVNIYGGTVKAHGMTHSDTNGIGIGVRREGGVLNFHMTDGEVTADVKDSGTSSHNEGDHVNGGGAGIGGDYKRCVELHMTIDGGTLTANGGTGGAGIGGGSSYENVLTMVVGGDVNSGSDITINGGTVTATGSSGGAGIGAGSGGNFHCTVTINDGTVTATSGWNGAGIGGGHEGAYYDIGGNGGDVIINGGKVTAYAYGTADDDLDNDDAQAIGHGQDDEDPGTLTIADNMCVKNDDGTETYRCDERVDRCRDLAKRIIEVCTHSSECTPDQENPAIGHTVHCTYCALDGQTEAHTYRSGDDACTKCGYNASGFNTVTIYMANADGSGYDDGTTTTVQYGSTYTLPDCTSVPDNTWFVGWKQTTDAPSSIQADDSEFSSLKSAGSEIEVKSNLTYYARYHSTIWPGGGNGTASDPYLISTEEDWNRLANDVSEKNFDFSGFYFKMTADISISQMVGSYSDGKNFRGTFDGDGHTLNVTLSGSGKGLAPFSSVRGATIKNLHVSGTVTVSSSNAGGLIGVNNGGTANITNCRVSVTISKSTQIYTGGIVGYVKTGTVNFTGCIFDGTLSSNGCGYWGGFVGYINSSNSKIIITDCLFKPESINVNTNTNCNTFSGTWHTSDMTISNGFYTQTCGTAQGTQAYTVESGTGLTLDYGSGTHYGEITAYNSGLLYDGKLYTGGTTKVYFTPEANFSFTELEASNGETLTANSNGTYTLTMESKNVTITAVAGTYTVILLDAPNTEDEPADPTNTATIAKNRDRIADVTIDGRTLYKDYNWNTLCLPFDMTAEQVSAQLAPSALMELDVEGTYTDANGDHQTGFDDGTLYLYFKDATKIKAGVPYIVKWDGNTSLTSPTFTSVTINSYNPETVTSDDGNVSFIGNYDPVTLEAGDKSSLYLGSSNKLYYPNAARPINSFRAYFQLNNGITADDPNSSDQNTPLVRAFVLNFGDDGETTGIVGVEHGILNIEHSAAAGWYDLSGRKLSGKPTKKGIYIYNGKKRVIK